MRLCIVCGAKVRNQNPKTNTCDEICTRAKHSVRTRQGQIEWEISNPHEFDHLYNNVCEDEEL